MNRETTLKRPVLYNPALWSRDEVRTYYVARHNLLERFLDDFRRERPGSRPQHRLILGQRGMGKSTLLRRLAIGVEDDPELASQWLPLIFPEEQYNVATLADFWLNCLDALGDFLEGHGQIADMKAIDNEVERLDRKDGEGALQALLRMAQKLDRRLLLLVDNIDLILERIKDKDWALREALQEHPELLLVGASSRALEATYDYGAAFYDFFRIDELRGLTEAEMRETIITLARQRGAEEVVQRVESDPGRLRVLHTLTGGNPRTAVLLYGVLLKGVDGDVRSDLESLLDEVTPLYKARFDELPPQGQQLLDKLALHWDPATARQLSEALGWQVNLVSAQLERLVQAGIVEKVKAGRGKRMAFQVGERFFNIWYLMRASRRVRRKLMWLVEFLRVFFTSDELHRLARERLENGQGDMTEAEYMLAIGRAIGPLPISQALETRALDCLIRGRSRLEEILDLSGEDSDLAPKAERIRMRLEARQRLERILGPGREEAVSQLCGLPVLPKELLALADFAEKEGDSGCDELLNFIKEVSCQQLRWLGPQLFSFFNQAIVAGDMADAADVDGSEAAAIRLRAPVLTIFSKLERGMRNLISPQQVESLARQGLAEDRECALFWVALGVALGAMDRNGEAIQALREADARDPDNSEILGLLGFALILDPLAKTEGIQMLRRTLVLNPEDTKTALRLSMELIDSDLSFEEGLSMARSFCAKNPEDSEGWLVLAGALLGLPDDADEQLAAARKAASLAEPLGSLGWLLACSLLAHEEKEESVMVASAWFDILASNELISLEAINSLHNLLRGAVVKGMAPEFLEHMDASGLSDLIRPTREALAAVVAGSAEVLNGVAPEVRKPALEILAIIAPSMVSLEMLDGPL